jgi:hypothetical protein
VAVCRHVRTASLLRTMLAPTPTVVVEGDRGELPDHGGVVIVRFDRTLPDLRGADAVVFCDYPWSTTAIDTAVGSAAETEGPSQVTVLHLADSIEDRLALLVGKRREMRGIGAEDGPPSGEELDYLLAPRW